MRPNRNFVQIYSYTEFEWLDIVEIEFQPGQERGTLGKVSIYHSQNHEVIILSNGKPLAMPLDFRACYTVKHSCSLLQDLSKLEQAAADRKVSEILDQGAKTVLSDGLGLVDFAIGLVNFALNLPNGQVKFF